MCLYGTTVGHWILLFWSVYLHVSDLFLILHSTPMFNFCLMIVFIVCVCQTNIKDTTYLLTYLLTITFYCVNHCSRNCVLPIANAMNSKFAAFDWLLSPLLYSLNILHSQELLLQQKLQLALYQQELLQVSSACFVCSITSYCENHGSKNCVLPIGNAIKSWFAAFDWLFSPLL